MNHATTTSSPRHPRNVAHCAIVAATFALATSTSAHAALAQIIDNHGTFVTDIDPVLAHVEQSGDVDSFGGSYIAVVGAGATTGSLRAMVQADGIPAGHVIGPPRINTTAESGDFITFHGPAPAVLDFSLSMNGTFGVSDAGRHRLDSTLRVGAFHNDAFVLWGGYITDEPTAGYFANGPVSNVDMDPTAISLVQHLYVLVTPDVDIAVDARFAMEIQPSQFSYASADFSHTAQLGIVLPSGWSFTSRSGTFLSDMPAPVPLPNTLVLCAPVIGWLGHRAGRGRRTLGTDGPCTVGMPARTAQSGREPRALLRVFRTKGG